MFFLINFRKNTDVNNEDDKDGERIFQNPTYEETTTSQPLTSSSVGTLDQENPPVVMYNTVKPPLSQAVTETENGQTYDILNRGQDGGAQAGMHSNRIVMCTIITVIIIILLLYLHTAKL